MRLARCSPEASRPPVLKGPALLDTAARSLAEAPGRWETSDCCCIGIVAAATGPGDPINQALSGPLDLYPRRGECRPQDLNSRLELAFAIKTHRPRICLFPLPNLKHSSFDVLRSRKPPARGRAAGTHLACTILCHSPARHLRLRPHI